MTIRLELDKIYVKFLMKFGQRDRSLDEREFAVAGKQSIEAYEDTARHKSLR